MKIAKNGISIDELSGFCELPQEVDQGLRGQGVPDATTNEAQRQEVHVEKRGGRIIPENKEGVVRSTGARDANGKGNVRAGYGCIGSSNFWHSSSRAGVECEDSLETNSNGSKVLSDTEMKVVFFVEKYRAYLGSERFRLRVDNRALSWLKTYSMD